MKNLMFEITKVSVLNMRKYLSIISIVESICEYSIYFVFINTFLKNINTSLVLLFLIIFNKYIYKNVINLKQLIRSENFSYSLLKPINPIYRLLVIDINPIDLILNTAITVTIVTTLPKYLIIILAGVIALFALHLFVLSITLITKNLLSVEKISMVAILICLCIIFSSRSLLGLTNNLSQLSALVFSLALLFISIKLWNQTAKNYS